MDLYFGNKVTTPYALLRDGKGESQTKIINGVHLQQYLHMQMGQVQSLVDRDGGQYLPISILKGWLLILSLVSIFLR